MNPGDRITVRISHTTTVEFYREYVPRKYRIRPADLPRLQHIFNSNSWPAHTHLGPNGLVELEFIVGDRELPEPAIAPEVEPDEEFWAPPLEPDPLDSCWDFRDTMNDEVAATRS